MVSFMYLCVCVLLFIFLLGTFIAGAGAWTGGLVSGIVTAVNRAIYLALRYGLSELLRTGGLVALLGLWNSNWRLLGRACGVHGQDSGALAGNSAAMSNFNGKAGAEANCPSSANVFPSRSTIVNHIPLSDIQEHIRAAIAPFMEDQTQEITQMRIYQENQREKLDFLARQFRNLTESVNSHRKSTQVDNNIVQETLVNMVELIGLQQDTDTETAGDKEAQMFGKNAEEPIDFWIEPEEVPVATRITQDRGVQCNLIDSDRLPPAEKKLTPCNIATIKTTSSKTAKPSRPKSQKKVNPEEEPVSPELLKQIAAKPLTEAADLVNQTLREYRWNKKNKPLSEEEQNLTFRELMLKWAYEEKRYPWKFFESARRLTEEEKKLTKWNDYDSRQFGC
jgi:TolA-binding protein